MNQREIVCIVCPNSCVMQVDTQTSPISVSGNKCSKGKEFAEKEITNPVRMLCTTAGTVSKSCPVLPVRLSVEIPKDKLFEAMEEINKITVSQSVNCGDVISENILGLGADLIATADLKL